MGRKDIVLVEKGEIASGELFPRGGTCNAVRHFANDVKSSANIASNYIANLGCSITLAVCASPRRASQLKDLERSVSRAKALGLECEVIGPDEAVKHMPQITNKDLYGAIYLPRDGQLDPYTTTNSMVKFAKDLGVTVYTNTRVTGIKLSAKGEVTEVVTDKGSIKTEIVINAAGLWAPRIAAMAGLHFPTTPVDHQHIALKAVPVMSSMRRLPVCVIRKIWFTCARNKADL